MQNEGVTHLRIDMVWNGVDPEMHFRILKIFCFVFHKSAWAPLKMRKVILKNIKALSLDGYYMLNVVEFISKTHFKYVRELFP